MMTCEECERPLREEEVVDIGILLVCSECAVKIGDDESGCIFDARERFTPSEPASYDD
jgi:hypothetical protein